MSTVIGRGAALLVAMVLALGLAACGDDDGTGEGDGTTSTTADTTSTTSTTEAAEQEAEDPEGEAVPVGVYFVRDEKVAAARADVVPPATARGAIEALLGGPAGVQGAEGMTSEIPDGTELLGLSIEDGTAVVDLSGAFTSGGGSLSMQLRAAQVVFTLAQFDTVDEVTFHIDGEEVDALGGEGVPAAGVDRTDFGGVTPLVLVTSPLPGEEVGSRLVVEGISNTFEANVLYEVVGAGGTTLVEGFTTASAGTGTWGDFRVEVELEGGEPGPVTLVAYQENMEDGGRQDVYEVPLQLR